MANRVKEDEKNERIIRSLLKLPDNRRCINCNSLGPQYVCTNFWTFVCTNCSGIHREFTHRVKSVSMAKFTSQEVSALQGGGNASAKEIYFKEWDPQRQSVPDSNNVERLRDFIKHVYVDRRYTGERSIDKPPRVKMGETEDFSESRKTDTYQGGSRSPPYEETYDRRYSDRPSSGGRSDDRNYRNSYDERSPGSDRENRLYSDSRRSPARTQIVNDWRRDNRFGNGRRSEDDRISDGGSKREDRSPDHQRDLDMSSPPTVRPVRDILGDNVIPLRIIEPPKASSGRSADVSVHTQRTASASNLASSNGNPTELRVESSLIDFDAVPEPPLTSTVQQTHQTAIGLSVTQPPTSSNDNWANFDSTPEAKVSQAPSNANLLESVISELSVPASLPGHIGVPGSGSASIPALVGNMSVLSSSNSLAAPVGHISVPSFGSGAPAAAPVGNSMAFLPSGASAAAPGPTFNSFVNVAGGGQWHSMHPQQHVLFPATGNRPPAQPFTTAVGGASSNQPWNSLLTPNTQVPFSASAAHVSQAVSVPAVEVTSGIVTQPSPVEVRPFAKKELPEDLFTSNYSSLPLPVPGWQIGPPHGIGFNMPYNYAMPMPTFLHPSKSINPFDLNNETSTPTFPSMASLQGALPNMAAPTGLLRTSSLSTPSPTWMPTQSSHPLAMPPQASLHGALPNMAPPTGLLRTSSLGTPSSTWMPPQPSHPLAMPPSSYMGHQVPTNMPPRQQGVVGFGIEQAAFGAFNPNQQQSGLHAAPIPNTFSPIGGNPFG